MQIRPFYLERYFAEHEFGLPFLLSASDCESLSLPELLGWADPEARALWEDLSLGYTESQGHTLLRQEIAKLYQTLTADDLLVVAPQEGILIALQALLEPGDQVVVTFPGYQSLYEVARSLGCRVTRWTFRAVEGGWRLDLDALADSLTPQTKLLVINFPHNPTGYLPARDELEAIVDLARTRGIHIFSDEMYRLLEHGPARPLPSVCDLYPRGVSLFGLSKTFSLPGLRVGWLATQDRALLQRFSTLKDYTTICGSAPSEILALIGLRARETIVARNLALIRRNLALAERFFEAHADRLDWLEPQAGSVAFPRLRGGLSADRFCQDLLDWGVMVVPGSLFEFPGEHVRLGLGRENLPQALERVGAYLSSLGSIA